LGSPVPCISHSGFVGFAWIGEYRAAGHVQPGSRFVRLLQKSEPHPGLVSGIVAPFG